MALKDELEDEGYRVLELAIRHLEALGLALKIELDLALVNIDLANGDDGVALARDLKACWPRRQRQTGRGRRSRSARTHDADADEVVLARRVA